MRLMLTVGSAAATLLSKAIFMTTVDGLATLSQLPIDDRPIQNHGLSSDFNHSKLYHDKQTSTSLEDLTMYQIISALPSTRLLAELIDTMPTIVNLLNSTASSYTLFAPSNGAFSRESDQPLDEDVLGYHIVPHPLTLSLLLATGITTVPSKTFPDGLNGPQRFTFGFDTSTSSFMLNSYSSVTTFDILASNGIVHLVDSFMNLPPPVFAHIDELPSNRFGKVQSAISKIDLSSIMQRSRGHGKGCTVFLPTNQAWEGLGISVLEFLATQEGLQFLEVLLKYHVVANLTLYSNNFYNVSTNNDGEIPTRPPRLLPRGKRHFGLGTLLMGMELSVDIWRIGKLILMRIFEISTFPVMDGISEDGVVHSIEDVLLPPCTNGKTWTEGLAEFKECLMGYVKEVGV